MIQLIVECASDMDIDDEKVFKTLPVALEDYREYIRQVDAFLDK